jgi:hypothetical protein
VVQGQVVPDGVLKKINMGSNQSKSSFNQKISSGNLLNWMDYCSTTGKPTRSFATERVSLDSV